VFAGSTDANSALTITLVRTDLDNSQILHQFHPKFTYPIFGEEERIFGYKGLEIDLKFAAHNLSPQVNISYDKKFMQVGSTVALDLLKTLKEFLPESTFIQKTLENVIPPNDFKPPGQLVHSYSRKGLKFQIWAGSLLDPGIRQILDNIQIFVLLFIEGGTYINTEDVDWTLERWRVYFVYEILEPSTPNTSPYSLAGYATTYRFYTFPPPRKQKTITDESFPAMESITPTTLPSRIRISQFLILPPYQSSGHGSSLYQSIYSEVMADPTVHELTIEDPSEEFDKLRDINDWKVLEPRFRAADIKINDIPPTEKVRRLPTSRLLPLNTLKSIQTSTKIADRQFARQLEMYLLSLIGYSHRAAGGASLTKLLVQKNKAPNADDRSYYWWRLIVKQRITKKNRDLLQQIDLAERIPQVEDSTRAQEDEYEGLLLYYAMMAAKEPLKNGNNAGEGSSRERKRKIISDDEDDEGTSSTGSGVKKTKA
jgi:histone acetyltransferase 1